MALLVLDIDKPTFFLATPPHGFCLAMARPGPRYWYVFISILLCIAHSAAEGDSKALRRPLP